MKVYLWVSLETVPGFYFKSGEVSERRSGRMKDGFGDDVQEDDDNIRR
jgi:hypothetical protein